MLGDPRLRDPMVARWSERMQPWVEIPPDLPAPARARLHMLRLAADGCWFADSSGYLPLTDGERRELLAVALGLLEQAVAG
jgi:hypothetical protein